MLNRRLEPAAGEQSLPESKNQKKESSVEIHHHQYDLSEQRSNQII